MSFATLCILVMFGLAFGGLLNVYAISQMTRRIGQLQQQLNLVNVELNQVRLDLLLNQVLEDDLNANGDFGEADYFLSELRERNSARPH